MARNKTESILRNVEIEAVAAEGKSLAHVEGAVLFVELIPEFNLDLASFMALLAVLFAELIPEFILDFALFAVLEAVL